jgi:hypothetical protein
MSFLSAFRMNASNHTKCRPVPCTGNAATHLGSADLLCENDGKHFLPYFDTRYVLYCEVMRLTLSSQIHPCSQFFPTRGKASPIARHPAMLLHVWRSERTVGRTFLRTGMNVMSPTIFLRQRARVIFAHSEWANHRSSSVQGRIEP